MAFKISGFKFKNIFDQVMEWKSVWMMLILKIKSLSDVFFQRQNGIQAFILNFKGNILKTIWYGHKLLNPGNVALKKRADYWHFVGGVPRTLTENLFMEAEIAP